MKNATFLSHPLGTTLILLLVLGFILPAQAIQHKLDFETGLGGWSAIKGTSLFNWARWTGGTHSGHTGPASAHEGSYYLYLEASRNGPAHTAFLQSPEFEADPESISFYYHMYGAHMGTLTLEGFDGANWITLWAATGERQKGHRAPWTSERITLSGKGVRQLRFKGTTDDKQGSRYRGDMAIDYVLVTTGEIPSGDNWRKTESGNGIYYGPGNVGVGDKQPKADLSILGNLSRPLTGRITVPANSSNAMGVGTRFTKELTVGDSLRIGNKVFIVTGIANDTALNLDAPHPVGAFNATAYTDSDLLSVETGAEVESLVIDKSGNVGIGKRPDPGHKLDVKGAARVGDLALGGKTSCGKLHTDASGKVACGKDADSGTITGVTAGSGLSGGGTSGAVTLNVDASKIQKRVSGTCAAGRSIRAIDETGGVTCEADDNSGGTITGVTAGSGLAGGGVSGTVSLRVDTGQIQKRVRAGCPAGQSIRVIDEAGKVTCEADDDSGTITGVTAGEGLSGGGNTGAVTLRVDGAKIQKRVSGKCAVGSSIREIKADGTVVCGDKVKYEGNFNSTSDTVPESYLVVTGTPACHSGKRGSIVIMRPSGAGNQDALCFCGDIDGTYQWSCFNP